MSEQPGRASPMTPELRSTPDANPPSGRAPKDTARGGDAQPGASTAEAIDRATASVGHDDGKR